MSGSASSGGPVEARAEVKASVTQMSAAAAQPQPISAPQNGSRPPGGTKEGVQYGAGSHNGLNAIPAQVPSPSLAGPTAAPHMRHPTSALGSGVPVANINGFANGSTNGFSNTFRISPAAPAATRAPARIVNGKCSGGTAFRGYTGEASTAARALTNIAKAAGHHQDGPAAVAVGRAIASGAPAPAVTTNGNGRPSVPIAKKYQIVFVTAEVAPWSKTGGLGEAMDGLPIALAALGHRVMTIAPRYDQYAEAWDTSYWSEVPMGQNSEPVHAFHAYESKVDRVFVDHDCFLAKVWSKTGASLYGPEWGRDFADNQWRFVYFAKAALKIIQELPLGGFPYGGDCILVVNDWHCGMVPVYLSLMKKSLGSVWANTKTALIIHNAVFQGRFDRDDPDEPPSDVYGLSEDVLGTFTMNLPIKVGRTAPKVRCLNWMASAAKHVDKIITVSPTYAWELLNLPEMSCELEEIFLAKGVQGIVNGVKENVSPMNAGFIKKAEMTRTFTFYDVDEKKAALKAELQEKCGLARNPNAALCVFVGRMDLQKGFDYLLAALQATMERLELQLIVIGTGRADLVASTKALQKRFPDKVYLAGWCGMERYAMVAGADYNLMPSRWEPCGLVQIEGMRFGTLPVVAQTGGLIDTVKDMQTGIHIGGAVSVEGQLDLSSVELMGRAFEKCVAVYADKELTSRMRRTAMAAGHEFTWSQSALQYEKLFQEMGVKDVLPRCGQHSVTLDADKA